MGSPSPAIEPIAPGVWRVELMTTFALAGRARLRTNVFALEERDGLSLIDCGPLPVYGNLRHMLARQFPGQPLRRVYLTHAHADHAGAGMRCRTEGLDVWAGSGDHEMLLDGGPWGVPWKFRYPPYRASGAVESLGWIELACGHRLEPVPMPGHTPGSFGFVDRERRLLLCGDTTYGPCGPGYGGTFLLEVLTSQRQPRSELRKQRATLEALHARLGQGYWLVLPGHGPPVLMGPGPSPFERSIKILDRIAPIARRS